MCSRTSERHPLTNLMLSITSRPVSDIASTVKITIEEHVTITNRDLVNHNQVEINMVRPIFILCQQTIFTRIWHLRPRIIKLCLLKLYTPDNGIPHYLKSCNGALFSWIRMFCWKNLEIFWGTEFLTFLEPGKGWSWFSSNLDLESDHSIQLHHFGSTTTLVNAGW